MSRNREGALFVGRLSKSTRTRDLEDLFETYGRVSRCDIKYGAEMGYAFVDFEDRRDAEDALKYENGREVCGSSIIVEWAKGNPRRPMGMGGGGGGGRSVRGNDECYKCRRMGHWARDCPDDRNFGFRRPNRGNYSNSSSSRRDRSRSRDRKRRSRSRSRSRGRRDRRSYSRSRSHSVERKRRRVSRSRSHSRSPSRSRSRSPIAARTASRSRSRSHSRNDLHENGREGSPSLGAD